MLRLASLAAAFAAALTFAPVAVVPAQAQSVTIDINSGRGISCRQGADRLRSWGYRDVTVRDCRGRFFVYRASRDRSRWEVALDSRNGRPVDKRWLRRL